MSRWLTTPWRSSDPEWSVLLDWFGRRAFVVRDARINGTVIVSGGAAIGAMTAAQQAELANFAYGGPWVAAAETSTDLRNTTIRYVGLDANGVVRRLGEINRVQIGPCHAASAMLGSGPGVADWSRTRA